MQALQEKLPTELTPAPEAKQPTLSVQKSILIQTLEKCIEWLNLNEEVLEEEAVALIDDRLSDHAKKSQVFLVVAVQKRMESLVRWMEASDRLEEKLLSPQMIESIDDIGELRKTIELFENKINSALKQITEMINASDALPDRVNDEEKQRRLKWGDYEVFNGDPQVDPVKREMTRNKLQELLARKRQIIEAKAE